MSLRARAVLEDCRAALAEFEQATDQNVKRRRWVALVALMRAVGHVLQKVDHAHADLTVRSAIEHGYTIRKDIPVFKFFIKAERDNVLKQYRFNPQEKGPIANVYVEHEFDDTGNLKPPALRISIEESVLLTEGHFSGWTPEQVAESAIDFWSGYLDDVERSASAN
ncbi:MAG TPA: hypothetical protein VK807_23740 [Gemmatimonadaceae bacterium]|jgi:hypothetical protein|nr:hypothetical protein [Gemmatimonadaceae bacterium]